MPTFDKTDVKAQTNTNTKKAAHDTKLPANLISFMLKDWKPPVSKKLPSVKSLPFIKKRREALSQAFPGEVLVIPSGVYKTRANDQSYPFRPSSDFYYLTGNVEPDCVFVLWPETPTKHRSILFVEPNPGKSDPTFFTDRVKGELWVGPRLGIEASKAKFGVDECRSLKELESFLKGPEFKSQKSIRVLRSFDPQVESWIPTDAKKDDQLAVTLSEMRLIKDSDELRELASAVNATYRGFEDVIKRLKTAKTERELEGVFYTRARMEGNDVGYASIVASGAHACTLHWQINNGKIRKGDLLLLDAGIEGNSLYTADITRTLPIGGKFSREQREIYELVHAAQAAAFKQVKPGNDFMAPNKAAMEVLAQGLADLGILKVSAEEALKDENQFYKRYSLHNVSHMLGLEVHDCARAREENYKFGQLKPGMVLTVEPGLYFQPDDLTVPSKYRGIGVRIEDDVVVTAKGCKNLSAGIPHKADDVEKWVKKLSR